MTMLPKPIVDWYTIHLLGQPIAYMDENRKIIRGWLYEGVFYFEKEEK